MAAPAARRELEIELEEDKGDDPYSPPTVCFAHLRMAAASDADARPAAHEGDEHFPERAQEQFGRV
jgi:hypothetical protein